LGGGFEILSWEEDKIELKENILVNDLRKKRYPLKEKEFLRKKQI